MKTSPLIVLIITVIVVSSLAFILDRFIQHSLILPPFLKLEQLQAEKDLSRCIQSLIREEEHLKLLNSDWANWDSLYNYVETLDPTFAKSNLEMETLTDINLDLVFIISGNGTIIADQIYDAAAQKSIRIRNLSADQLDSSHPFIKELYDSKKQVSGLVVTEHGIMILAAHQILTSSGQGEMRGILVMGRFLTPAIQHRLNEQTLIPFTLIQPPFNEVQQAILSTIKNGDLSFTTSTHKHKIKAYAVLNDIYQNPSLILVSTTPRSFYEQGVESAWYSSKVILGSFLTTLVILFFYFLFFRYKQIRQHREIELLVRKKTQRLNNLSSQLRALTNASTEALLLLQDGDCIAMNQKAQEMFGYTEEEFNNHPTIELVVAEERDRVRQIISENIQGYYETTGLRKDQSTFPLYVHASSAIYEGKTIRAVALVDLTKQREEEAARQLLEDKLQRSRKMESIGLMAGSVAHDLNNILSGVVTYPELLLLSIDNDNPLRKPLEKIRESGKKAADIVADLLTIARGIALALTPIDINRLIKNYLDSPEFSALAKLYPEISFQTNLAKKLSKIAGSEIHINKVLMNLVNNGAEAIGDKGIVEISTEQTTLNERFEDLPPGQYIKLCIRDNGKGIPQADLARIFEPFYSRKVKGRSGTGLGLAIVANTMHDHKGAVSVKSDDGGTVFTLYFPSSALNLPDTSLEKVDINTLKGENQSILVVDDNKQQLEIAEQILNTLNYTVHTASSGEEALRFLKDNQVDLLILDMIMEPGINGYQTYLGALKCQPEQKAIIASGFSVNKEVELARKLGVEIFIRKPYSIAQIGSAVKSVFEK